MSQSVTGSLKITASASETITNGLGSGALTPSLSTSIALSNGSGSGTVGYQWSKTGELDVSTPVTLTLSALTDDLGRTIAFTKIRVLMFQNFSTVDGQVITLGAAATHPWTAPFGGTSPTIKVPAGGTVVLSAPLATAYAVTASSSDQLEMDPGSDAQGYRIIILGE